MRKIKVSGNAYDILQEGFKVGNLVSDTENENDLNTVSNLIRIKVEEAMNTPHLIWDEGTWDDYAWN